MRVFAIGTYAYIAHARDSKSIVLAHFFMGRLCLFQTACHKDGDPSSIQSHPIPHIRHLKKPEKANEES